jgi:hypothetical protein
MGDTDETLNNTPEMRDAIRSIEAIGEDQSGVEETPPDAAAADTPDADPADVDPRTPSE